MVVRQDLLERRGMQTLWRCEELLDLNGKEVNRVRLVIFCVADRVQQVEWRLDAPRGDREAVWSCVLLLSERVNDALLAATA